MNKLIFSVLLVLTAITSGFAQQDNEGCKDHPLLTRMPDYYILECTQNYNQLDFYNSKGEEVKLEGNLNYAWYLFNMETGKPEPSRLQIVRNYSNAILKIGGKKVYEEDGLGCYELNKNGKEYKIKVTCTNNSDFLLHVLEIEAMKQDITANDMLDALNKAGFITLHILFETGKSTIQSESLPVIDQVYELLKLDAALKISIEGHTDNVGTAASNKKLSEERAKSVMGALVARGIDKTRLSSAGWGQEKPVADNKDEQGRAQNRRVELIKKP